MNRRAKCNLASFILGGEIRNRTHTYTHKNSKRYPHLAYRHVWIKTLFTESFKILCRIAHPVHSALGGDCVASDSGFKAFMADHVHARYKLMRACVCVCSCGL